MILGSSTSPVPSRLSIQAGGTVILQDRGNMHHLSLAEETATMLCAPMYADAGLLHRL